MKKLLTALAFVSALAPAAAFAGPNDGHGRIAPAPVRPMTPAQRPVIVPQHGPAMAARLATVRFTRTVESRVASAESSLRTEIARGRVRPVAQRAFATARANVESALQSATRDGSISNREEARVNQLLTRLEQVGASYRIPTRGHR